MEELKPKLLSKETTTCPVCNTKNLEISVYYYNIPLVGGSMITVFHCKKCSFRTIDVYATEYTEPRKYILNVTNSKDLGSIVVKSSKAEIYIPELGIEIYPGAVTLGYITTVDGLLERVLEVFPSDCDKRCEEKRKLITLAMEGKVQFKVILVDKYGGSTIIPKDPKKLRIEKIKIVRQ